MRHRKDPQSSKPSVIAPSPTIPLVVIVGKKAAALYKHGERKFVTVHREELCQLAQLLNIEIRDNTDLVTI